MFQSAGYLQPIFGHLRFPNALTVCFWVVVCGPVKVDSEDYIVGTEMALESAPLVV